MAGILITDDFDRADENPIYGPNGTHIWGSNGILYEAQLVGKKAKGAMATALTKSRTPIGSADQWVEATLDTNDTSGEGLCVSMQGNADTDYQLAWWTGGTTVLLRKCVAGTYTNLATFTVTLAVGDIMRLEKRGTMLQAFRNGISLGSVTDTAIGYGDPGLWFSANLSGRLTRYSAGPMPEPPIPSIPSVLYNGDPTIAGAAVPSWYVSVTRNGTEYPAVLVDNKGQWDYTFGTALATGDTVKVRLKSAAQVWGPFSRTLTVQAAVLKPPVLIDSLYAGNYHIVGASRRNASIEIFKNGTSLATLSADNSGVFRYVSGAALVASDYYTAKQTVGGTQTAVSAKVVVAAAPANTDTYKTNIFDTLTLFDYIKDANDTDDIRRGVALVLDQATLLSSTTHEIKNAMPVIFGSFASIIAARNG